jgi:hypothetical protein
VLVLRWRRYAFDEARFGTDPVPAHRVTFERRHSMTRWTATTSILAALFLAPCIAMAQTATRAARRPERRRRCRTGSGASHRPRPQRWPIVAAIDAARAIGGASIVARGAVIQFSR